MTWNALAPLCSDPCLLYVLALDPVAVPRLMYLCCWIVDFVDGFAAWKTFAWSLMMVSCWASLYLCHHRCLNCWIHRLVTIVRCDSVSFWRSGNLPQTFAIAAVHSATLWMPSLLSIYKKMLWVVIGEKSTKTDRKEMWIRQDKDLRNNEILGWVGNTTEMGCK